MPDDAGVTRLIFAKVWRFLKSFPWSESILALTSLTSMWLAIVTWHLYKSTNDLAKATAFEEAARAKERNSPPVVAAKVGPGNNWEITIYNSAPFPINVDAACRIVTNAPPAAESLPPDQHYTIPQKHLAILTRPQCKVGSDAGARYLVSLAYTFYSLIDKDDKTMWSTLETTWAAREDHNQLTIQELAAQQPQGANESQKNIVEQPTEAVPIGSTGG